MYPLYFYVCLLASLACVVILILLAVFPVKLPIAPKTSQSSRPVVRQRKARSPTRRRQPVTYWNSWDDDDEDL